MYTLKTIRKSNEEPSSFYANFLDPILAVELLSGGTILRLHQRHDEMSGKRLQQNVRIWLPKDEAEQSPKH